MSVISSIVWEDREVKFDIPHIQTKLRGGEKILDVIDDIEDTKGNIGDSGRLLITNLRLIWYSMKTSKFSLSLGYLCIITMTIKNILSQQRGTTQALYILSSQNNSRFEFIYTNLNQNNTTHFKSVFDVYRLYQSTILYRDLKLRSAVVSNGQLNVLSQEQVYNTLNGVWNLSSDQGNLGTFIVTNIRIIWFADVNETFNISLPFMQIMTIRVRESKYGPALVIHTVDTGGSYILGFRIDPAEKLGDVYKELISLHSVYGDSPNFGIHYVPQNDDPIKKEKILSIEDIEEIDNSKSNEVNINFTAYLSENNQGGIREPFYCKELGFSMEKIKDGYTLKDLWDVIT